MDYAEKVYTLAGAAFGFEMEQRLEAPPPPPRTAAASSSKSTAVEAEVVDDGEEDLWRRSQPRS